MNLGSVALASDESDLYKGRKLFDEIIQKNPPYKDPKLQNYVNQVGQRIASMSDRPDLRFVFLVMDQPSVNAYALPGGFVFVDRGLLAFINTEDQLAAVLAHEIAHVTAKHSARREGAIRSSQAWRSIASVTAYWYTGSSELGSLPSHLGQAWIGGYGRKMELEADEIGLAYLIKAGYNHSAMLDVITLLKFQATLQRRIYRDRGQRPPTYHGVFATHPRNDKRLYEVLSNAKKLPKTFGYIEPIDDYLSQINGLAFGPSGSSGFDPENIYYNVQEGFSVDFPDSWNTQIQSSGITGYPLEHPEKAYIQLQVRYLGGPIPDPVSYVQDTLGVPIEGKRALNFRGFKGLIAEVPTQTNPFEKKRIAVLFDERKVYIFVGALKEEQLYDEWLIAFDSMVPTLQQLAEEDQFQATEQRIRIYTTKSGDSYVSLSPPGAEKNTIDQLKLLNGDYPRGEFGPGERVKVLH